MTNELDKNIAEVLELDSKRTQGEWRWQYGGEPKKGKAWIDVFLRDPLRKHPTGRLLVSSHYEMALDHAECRFIAAAPKMVSIIRQLVAERELLIHDVTVFDDEIEALQSDLDTTTGALEFYASGEHDYNNGEIAQQALDKINNK